MASFKHFCSCTIWECHVQKVVHGPSKLAQFQICRWWKCQVSMKNHGWDKYATKNKYDKIAQNFRTLLECSSACLSAGATCLAFSFESEECELGGDPGESPTQPSGTPTLPSFATKLVDGQKAVYAKKCKMGMYYRKKCLQTYLQTYLLSASLLQSPDLSTCSELRIIDWMFLENPPITSYTLHSDFFNEPNRCDDGAIATVTWMNFWSGRNYIVGDYFVVDLGCCVTLRKVILRNSYNAWALPDGSSERY